MFPLRPLPRRKFIRSLLGSAGAMVSGAAEPKKCRILVDAGLLSSKWGGFGRIAGFLSLVREMQPSWHLTLWCHQVDELAREFFAKYFPQISLLTETLDDRGRVATPELRSEFQRHDYLLALGPATRIMQGRLEAWVQETGNPFGTYAFSIRQITKEWVKLLHKAHFVGFAESGSRQALLQDGLPARLAQFTPDPSLFTTARSGPLAAGFRRRHELTEGAYVLVGLRHRYSPAWEIFGRETKGEEILQEKRNAETVTGDVRKCAQFIDAMLGKTDWKVVLWTENPASLRLAREDLVKELPAARKDRLVVDGALMPTPLTVGLCEKAAIVVGMDLSLCGLALAGRSTCLYLDFPEAAPHGRSWNDLGLGAWTMDWEASDAAAILDRMQTLRGNRLEATETLKRLFEFAQEASRPALEQVGARAAG